MAPIVRDTPTASDADIELLASHLPQSFHLLRRLQSTRLPGGSTTHSHVLFAQDPDKTGGGSGGGDESARSPGHFAMAYLDFSMDTLTAMWFYSTLEDDERVLLAEEEEDDAAAARHAETRDECLDLGVALFRRVRSLGEAYEAAIAPAQRKHQGGVLVGCMHEATREALVRRRGLTCRYWNPFDKWLFRVEDLPAGLPDPLAPNMRWDVVRRSDVPVVISRTHIPKTEEVLMSHPSAAVRLTDGTPVAWGFLGFDGCLSTLHCEEPYRGRGIAKAVAIRTIRDNVKVFGDDGWAAADVAPDNLQSQGVCKSIGGKKSWRMCWTTFNFDSIQ